MRDSRTYATAQIADRAAPYEFDRMKANLQETHDAPCRPHGNTGLYGEIDHDSPETLRSYVQGQATDFLEYGRHRLAMEADSADATNILASITDAASTRRS
jgi:hypothetical protein